MIKKIFIAVFVLISAGLIYGFAAQYMAMNDLGHVPKTHVMGNPDGDLTVVKFLDYRCPYCREAHPTIREAIERDGQVRFVIRPVVMVDPHSVAMARTVYAASAQDAFISMHERLITEERAMSEVIIKEHSDALGLNWDQMKSDLESEATENFLIDNHRVFSAIGGNATPTFMIGPKIKYVPEGQMPRVADFMRMFAEARSKGMN